MPEISFESSFEFGQHLYNKDAISFLDFIVVHSEKGGCLFLGSKTRNGLYKKNDDVTVKLLGKSK